MVDPTQINDLAILKLATPVAPQYQFTSLAQTNPELGSLETIAGYGVNTGAGVIGGTQGGNDSGILRSALSRVKNITAQGSYLEIGGYAAGNPGYTKICQGDSGGPDLIADAGGYRITGVHSFGDGANCGSAKTPASSVSVAYYANWLNGAYLQLHI